MKPNSGNPDVDRWIVDTFRRRTRKSELMGATVQELEIQPIEHAAVLNEDQLFALIRYLQNRFCPACGGTTFDPETLNGECEYCRELPF